MNKLDEFWGPAAAVAVVVLCTVLLGYFAFLAQDQDFIDRHPAKRNCDDSELQIAGYCCKSVDQYESGSCTN